jgi:hypothetical protein
MNARCDCGCHRAAPLPPPKPPCCACVCECRCHQGGAADPNGKRCCGQPTHEPPDPTKPGWKPGDQPASDPLAGAVDADDKLRRLRTAVMEAAVGAGMPGRGVKFGPRKNEFLPFLVIRSNPGDHGDRPYQGAWWESPDIFVQPDQEASTASAVPPTLGGSAIAGRPNTLWAHVWNLGRSPAFNVRVEFYWFDPTTGFNADGAHLIGATYVDLGARDSTTAHTIVKCPNSWRAQFVDGGHECLLVRCFDPLLDALGPNPWHAAENRHVGQRNITVVEAQSPAVAQMTLRLGCADAPGQARIDVVQEKLDHVPWLALLGGRNPPLFRDPAAATVSAGVLPPFLHGGDSLAPDLRTIPAAARDKLLRRQLVFQRGCDELAVPFFVSVDGLRSGEATVFRVIQRVDERITGGYTMIAHKR